VVAEPVNETTGAETEGPIEIMADKGYHSREAVREIGEAGVRTYLSEPERGRQRRATQ